MRGEQAAEFGPIEKAKILPEMVIAHGAPGDDFGKPGARRVSRPGLRQQKIAQQLFLHRRLDVGRRFQGECADRDVWKPVRQDIAQIGTLKASSLRRGRLAPIDLLERPCENTGKHMLVEAYRRIDKRPLADAARLCVWKPIWTTGIWS